MSALAQAATVLPNSPKRRAYHVSMHTPSSRTEATSGLGEDEAAIRVLRHFRSVFNAVKTHFRQVEKQAGLGGALIWALAIVRERPGIGVGALARAMDVHQTTASNLVRTLVGAGMLESQRSGADRRATELKITRSGRRTLGRAPGPFAGVLPDALRKLDAATLRRLEADLGTLLALLHADRRSARIPLAEM